MAKNQISETDVDSYLQRKRQQVEAVDVDQYMESRIEKDKPQAEVSPVYSPLEAGAVGAGQSLSLGLSDEAIAAAKSAMEAPEILSKEDSLKELKRRYQEFRDIERAKIKLAQEQQPLSYTAGAVVGAAPLAFVPGAAGIAGSAALGAVGAIGTSEADLTEPTTEELKELGKDIAIGGTLGGGLAGISKGIGALKKLDPVKSIIEAGEQGLEGELLVGEKARRGLGQRIVGLAKKTGESISQQGKTAAQAKRQLIDEAEAAGRTVELAPVIDEMSARQQEMYAPLLAEQKTARASLVEPILETLTPTKGTGFVEAAKKQVAEGSSLKDVVGTERIPIKQMESLRRALGKLGYVKDLKDDDVVALAKTLSGKSSSLLTKEVPELGPVNKRIQDLLSAEEIFNIGGSTVDDMGSVKQLTPLIERIEKEGITGDIARERFKQGIESLKSASPELGEMTEKQFEDLSKKYMLAKQIGKEGSFSDRALTTRAGMGAANILGYGAKKTGLKPAVEIAAKAAPLAMPSPVSLQTVRPSDVQETSTAILSRNLYDLPLDNLNPVADELSKDPSFSSQADALRKAITEKDSKAKDRVLFTLMQNPKAREIMKQIAGE